MRQTRFTTLASLTLLAIPVLHADVTIRYKSDVKMNSTLPPAMTAQATVSIVTVALVVSRAVNILPGG